MRIMLILIVAFLGAGCVKQKLTFEEIQMREANEQCQQEATQMNPENSGAMNPFWNSYYTMCMNRFGYTQEQINTLWR